MERACARGLLALGAALALTVSSAPARANGRFPASNMLVSKPGDPSHLALRATYGLLFSHDGGGSWDWVCEKAVGYGGAEDPSIAMTASGAVVVGLFRGMARTTDDGCTWQHDPSWPSSVVDLTVRKTAPDRVYAATCVFAKVADAGGSLFKNAISVSDDAGQTWTTRATLDPTLLVDSVEVADTDARRVYVSAIRPHGTDTTGLLLVSDDDGAHFQERPVPFGVGDRGVYIAAVDPKNPARVYLRTTGVDAGRLLVTDDAGKTIREAFHGGPLPGFALADDGATVFLGGPKDGLLRSTSDKLDSFDKRNTMPVQCLTSIGPTLWACAPVGVGFVLGASDNAGRSFDAKLTLAGRRGARQCGPGSTVADVCAADWSAFQALVNPRLAPSKDALPAGSASAGPVSKPAATCGCATPGGGSSGGLAAGSGALFVVAALVLQRRRATVSGDGRGADRRRGRRLR